MSWIFEQSTGKIFDPTGTLAAFGYSGYESGKNNPELQDVADVGPIPEGTYAIGSPYDSKEHGPFVLPLTPDADNKMFDRYGFLVHGDSKSQPGMASYGCIVVARDVREEMANSLDKYLEVVATFLPEQELA